MATKEAEVIKEDGSSEFKNLFEHTVETVTLPVETETKAADVLDNKTTEELKFTDPAEIKILLDSIQNTTRNNLERIALSEELFEKIRANLVITIKSLEKNPSKFTRAAEFWGEVPLWQKIIGGIVLTLPMLILGIIFNIGFLVALCGITTAIYTGASIILDDHHQCALSIIDSLTNGIIALANFLEITIKALEEIHAKLAAEVEKFTQENDQLKLNVNTLNEQVDALSTQIQAAQELASSLESTKKTLETAAEELTQKLITQNALLDENKNKIEEITQNYLASQETLTKKIAEFGQTEIALNQEMERIKNAATVIQDMATTITNHSLTSKDQQEFQSWIEETLKNKDKLFIDTTKAITVEREKLERTEEKLRQCNKFYEDNLKVLTNQIEKLESIIKTCMETPGVGEALNKYGVFANIPQRAGAFLIEPQENPLVYN